MEYHKKVIERTRLTEKKLSAYRARILREVHANNMHKARAIYDIVMTIREHYYTGLNAEDINTIHNETKG